MKVLLVTPKFYMFPVGIAYISAALKRGGHDVDCQIYDRPADLIETVRKKRYDFVATGGLSSQFARLRSITDIAQSDGVKIIAGGGIITSEPELMSRALHVDYAVIGEGEEIVNDLLACLEKKGDLSQVAGVGYLENGNYVFTQARKPIEDISSLPWPDYDGFEFSRFLDSTKSSDMYYYSLFDHPREYPIVMSRSCPYLCTFCYHPIGNKYRQRSIDSVMTELETVIPRYRINLVSIYDELFSCNAERVHEFCTRFKEFTQTLSWEVRWGCQMRVAGLTNSMLDAMRDAGCCTVSYGFESYSPAVLKSMRKAITPQQIHQAIHATLDRSIAIQGNFIFGDRAETLQTAQETLDFWKSHPEAGITLAFILACPDSDLYQYACRSGIIKDKLDFLANHLSDALNLTNLSEADFMKLRVMVAKYWLNHNLTAVPLRRTPTSMVVRCPHCKNIIEYKNFTNLKIMYSRPIFCRICRKKFFVVSQWTRIYDWWQGHTLTPLTFRLGERISPGVNRIYETLRPFLKKMAYRLYRLEED